MLFISSRQPAKVKLLIEHEVTGSSPKNGLVKKCRKKTAYKTQKQPDPRPGEPGRLPGLDPVAAQLK
jgi:hypothetical protein